MNEHDIDVGIFVLSAALFVFLGIPWMCVGVWLTRMENSDPVRSHQLKRARQEFKTIFWREIKTVIGKHLRK